MKVLIRILVTAAIAFILAQFVPGVYVAGYGKAICFAMVPGLLTIFLRPLQILFALPLTLFTFGLFIFSINSITVMLASDWVNGFEMDSFGQELLFSLLLTMAASLLYGGKIKQEKEQT